MFSWVKNSHSLGLDIHADEIRLVRLRKKRKVYCLENFALAALPPGAIIDGRIRQFDVVRAAVNQLVEDTRTRGSAVAIALPASSVICKRISLSACLSREECEAEITTNFKRYFPGITEELCFDFVMLDTVNNNQHEILLVASRSEQLNTYVAVANDCGLKVKIVDVDSYALVRAGNFWLTARAAVAVLDVASEVTQFLIFQRHHIIYSQQWQSGDTVFLEAQVRRALQLSVSAHQDLRISHFILAGKKLALNLDMEVMSANPFQKMRLPPRIDQTELQTVAPRFLVACGLALRGFSSCQK